LFRCRIVRVERSRLLYQSIGGGSLPPHTFVLVKNRGKSFLHAMRIFITSRFFSGPNPKKQILVISIKRFPRRRYQMISTEMDILPSLSLDEYTKKPGDFSSGEITRSA
jgi:hypothetical protein